MARQPDSFCAVTVSKKIVHDEVIRYVRCAELGQLMPVNRARRSLTMHFRFDGRPPASRFMRFITPVPATALIASLHIFKTTTKKSMYKGIVKKQVSDGP